MSWLLLVLIVLVQGVSGGYLWRLLRPGPMTWSEAGGMGLALGTAGAVLAGCLGFWLPIGSPARSWMWAIPAVVVAVPWAVRRARGRALAPLMSPGGAEWMAVAVGLVVGAFSLLANLTNYPLAWSGAWTGYHQDMVFFEALATGMSTFSPGDSIFMAGADIRYHWLSYAWVGQLTAASGAAPFVVLTRVLPVVALLGALLVVVGWSRRLSQQVWVPSLAALLLVSGGYVGAIYGAILNFDSPSQALTTMWLLGLCVALLAALQGGPSWGWAFVVLVLALGVSGGKFSSIVVAAGGFGLLTLVGLATRAPWCRRALLLSGVGVLATLLTYVLLVSGSAQAGGLGLWSLLDRASSVQGLNPQTTDRGILAGTALLILAMVARWAGLAWLAADRRTRLLPETVLGVGMAIVGVLTIALVSGGFNDMWFALAASAPLSVLSAVGVGNAAAVTADGAPGSPSRIGGRAAWAFGLGVAAAVPVAVVWGTGAYAVGGWRWAAPVLGLALAALIAGCLALPASNSLARSRRFLAYLIVASVAMSVLSRPLYLGVERVMSPTVAPHDEATYAPVTGFVASIDRDPLLSVTSDQSSAGRWLRAHSDPTDIVATNVTYGPLVPALTGRRTLVSGIHYQAPYGRPDQLDELLEREKASYDFIDQPSGQSAGVLCAAGVDWVWVNPARTAVRDWFPWARVVLEKTDVILLRMIEEPR